MMKRTWKNIKKEIQHWIKKLELMGGAAAFALRN